MNESLTRDERRCLQLWLRQAIAKLEMEEATVRFAQSRKILEGRSQSHRDPIGRRRSRRTAITAHAKELVT